MRALPALLAAGCLLAATPTTARAAPPPALLEAESALEKLQLAQAEAAAARTLDFPGLHRDAVLRALSIQGEVKALLGKNPASVAAFEQLLVLEPNFEVEKRWSPKVQSRFFEAKAQAKKRGALGLELNPQRKGDLLIGIDVGLKPDPSHLATTLVIHIAGQPDLDLPIDGSGGTTHVQLRAPLPAQLWAELLSAKGQQFVVAHDEAHPLKVEADKLPPPVAVPTASLTTAPEPRTSAPAGGLDQPAPAPLSLRPAAYAVGGTGLAALAIGSFFGIRARQDASTYAGVERNGSGQVTSLTQTEAQALVDRSAWQAPLANVLLIGGGALVATGVGLFLFGPDGSSPQAAEE